MKNILLKYSAWLPLVLILLISAGFRFYTIDNQFEVWDEYTVVRYGENYLNFIKTGDFSKESWALNREHPPFSKYFYGATRIISLNIPYFRDVLDQDYPVGRRYTFQRIISALVGLGTVILVYFFAKSFYSKRIALLASLFLGLNTYHIAHSRVATQENLVGFLTLLATFLFYKALKSENFKSKWYLVSGVFLGIAFATKYNAVFFFILFALMFLLAKRKALFNKPALLLKNYAILTPLIATVLFMIIWPWLWVNPMSQFLESTGSRVGFSRVLKPATEYFMGVYPHNSPWYYFFVYFAATIHPVFLLGLTFFMVKVFLGLKSKADKNVYDYWFLLYFLTPFLAAFSPLKMDGIRYIFTVFSALSIVSAVGVWYMLAVLNKFLNISYGIKSLVLYSMIFALILTNLNFHPFYLDYYNSFFGGVENVYNKKLFDFGYWGEGLRNTVNFINKDAKNGDVIRVNAVPTHVLPQFKDGLVQSHLGRPNYVIVNPTGWWLKVEEKSPPLDSKDSYKVVYEEKLFDVPMVQVYKLSN